MAYQLSPGVNVSEIDLTTVVPAVATSSAAFAGVFRWGPVAERVLVDSENTLVKRFGKPTNYNAETFFTAANFLSYASGLYISRAANYSGATPSMSATISSGNTTVLVTNTSDLAAGMYVSQSSNTSVLTAGESKSIASITNSTAFVLSVAPSASGTSTLYFGRPETSYSALALESTSAFVANLVNQIVLNETNYETKDGTFDADVLYVAKYPGEIGNSLRVAICDTANAYQSNVSVSNTLGFTIGSNSASIVGVANLEVAQTVAGYFTTGDNILAGNTSIGKQYLRVMSVSTAGNTTTGNVTFSFEDPYRLRSDWSSNTIQRYWEFWGTVGSAPGQSDYVRLYGNSSANDELHVVVVDEDGLFSGTTGTILEVYKGLSRASDAKSKDNTTNYYKDVLNQQSAYIWWANDRTTAVSNTAQYVTSATSTAPGNYDMTLGSDGYDEANSSAFSIVAQAYDQFVSAEAVDIGLVLTGKPIGGTTVVDGQTVENFQIANYVIDNICEIRKDCVAVISPDHDIILNNIGNEALSLKNWRGAIRDTSYGFLDSGYKYMYDRYNDIYRWVPLNGDIGGLFVRTENSHDAWWSPAGLNRGQIKNIVKLSFNPNRAERDVMYSNGVNPVVSFPGQGTYLYGDKTLQVKPSAFDRINVRRLFIVLEKAISIAAKYSLFEFNDPFTRAQFKNMVTPYLRSVQGRRGITDFLVVCDESNNDGQVVDSNQFVGDIYIKPARVINFIQLNFVAVGTDVQFSEVIGNF